MATAKKSKTRIRIDLEKVESLAAVGCTIAEIAVNLGVSERTLYNRMAEEEKNGVSGIADAVARGRAQGIATIENSLFKAAQTDWRAAAFWLCNRAPDRWQSMNKVELSGKNGAPLQPPSINVNFVKPDGS